MENFFTRYTTAGLSSRPFQSFNITALEAGMFFSHFFTPLPCCLTLLGLWLFKIPLPDEWFSRLFRDSSPSPPLSRPPPGGYLCFSNYEPAHVLLHCLSRLLRDAFSGCFFSRGSFWISPPFLQGHFGIPPPYKPSSLPLYTTRTPFYLLFLPSS